MILARVSLSWPVKELSPNARVHWAQKARAAKSHRAEARTMTPPVPRWEWPVSVEIKAHPPDRRRRDMDNVLASLKPALDGVAEGLGVDDSRFRLVFKWGEPVKGGRVDIVARGLPDG